MNVNSQNSFSNEVRCPWCHKGKMLADGFSNIRVSNICNRCNQGYTANFKDGTAVKGRAGKEVATR